jgi:hypothetical protein
MLRIPETLPVRTRIPLAIWAVAAVVTLFSLTSSLLHLPTSNYGLPSAAWEVPSINMFHQAKV